MTNATREAHGISLKFHACAAAIAEAATSEIRLNILNQKRDTRGETLKDAYEFRTV
jgi:hypothetical protein